MTTTHNESQTPLQPTLGSAKRPLFSPPQVIWYIIFGGLAFLNMMTLDKGPAFTVTMVAIGVVGALPISHEGPLFIRIYVAFRHLWWRVRKGVLYNRKLSDAAKFYNQDGSRISAPFDVALQSIPLRDTAGRDMQLATFSTPDGRHSAMLSMSGWSAMAMADPGDAATYTSSMIGTLLDVLTRLKPGDRLTTFGCRRPADTTSYATYVAERVHEDILHATPDNPDRWEEREDLYATAEHIYGQGWDHTIGMVVNVPRPTYWRPGKLDKLTPAQIASAPLVQALKSLAIGLEASGLDEVRLQNLYEVARTIKSSWALGPELDRYRALVADDQARDAAGQFQSFLEADSLRIGPWPLSRVELHRDRMVMDGSNVRVLWVPNFAAEYAHLGAFEAVYRLPVPSLVSVSATVLDSRKSNRRLRNQADFKQAWGTLFRDSSLMQDPAKAKELEQAQAAWESFRANNSLALDIRMLIIVAGSSLEELDDNEAMAADQLEVMRLATQRVIGETDQLHWFFAALGMKHAG